MTAVLDESGKGTGPRVRDAFPNDRGRAPRRPFNLFAFAIRHEHTAADLEKTIYAYPTHAPDIGYMV